MKHYYLLMIIYYCEKLLLLDNVNTIEDYYTIGLAKDIIEQILNENEK